MGNTNGYYKKLNDFLDALTQKKAYFVRLAIRKNSFRDFIVASFEPEQDWKIIYDLYHFCLENNEPKIAEKIRLGVEEYNTDFNTKYNLTA